jgi:uncharacterized cupredoxin-like copper-binding protein
LPDGEKLNITFIAPKHDHAAMPATAAINKNKTAKPKPAAASTAKHLAKRVIKKPASWGTPDHSITIGTKPGLKFTPEQFQVKAGSKVQITFNNNDDMLHNLVVVIQGTAIQVGEAAMKLGLAGQEKNYIPETSKVLFHTKLLEPHTSESIYFIAPEKPGDYTFVCTIPGHFYTMQGVMKVVK